MKISIVIPVYNEAAHLEACLLAIADQTVQPFEVIVVDNNSTDSSVAIARSYAFVTVLHEKKQGVVFARDTGFNYATGDIIGRIDADTIINANWVETVRDIFTASDVGAITGRVSYSDVAFSSLVSRIDLFWRRRMARLLGREVAMQGANMAIRNSVWHDIRSTLCHRAGIHEDFDLAIHTNNAGHEVRFEESLVAGVCYRQAGYDFLSFSHYALISPRTYKQHGLKSARYMYQVVAFVIVFYLPIKLLHRGYSKTSKKFSWARAFSSNVSARVNPATFVD